MAERKIYNPKQLLIILKLASNIYCDHNNYFLL